MINHLGNEQNNLPDRKYEMQNTKTPHGLLKVCSSEFRPGKIVVIAWNEFAKSCYNHQQTNKGSENFQVIVKGVGQLALHLVQSGNFDA